MDIREKIGQRLVFGFPGTTIPAEFAALVASVAFFVADFIPSTTDWIYSSDTLTLLLNISTPIVHSPLNEVHSGSSDIFFFIISL